MVKREKLIASYVEAGYPLDYILAQETIGWSFVKNGTTPDGNVSDMACTFWSEAPPEAFAKGKIKRRNSLVPDKDGFVYFSREREGECCGQMLHLRRDSFFECEVCNTHHQ